MSEPKYKHRPCPCGCGDMADECMSPNAWRKPLSAFEITECTCPYVNPSLWTTYGSAVEPASMQEYDPGCPEHGIERGRS